MATSFRPIASSGNGAHAPDWIAALQQSSGFVMSEFPPALPEGSSGTINEQTDVQRAYHEGEIAGRAAVTAEQSHDQAQRAKLQLALAGFDEAAGEALKSYLIETIISLCKQVIDPILIDHNKLTERCELAISKFGTAPAQLKLRLHPSDAELVEPELKHGPQLVPDKNLERGTIRLEGPDGVISDGPKDWDRLIREALGR